ncbi:MAG: diguanylate cyclase [Halomonas sp.]|nr:diguanylate cyclase [Halomonas sp.]TVP47645.1 MAG: diguanylate cyclase [Halomonas sp.]
MADSNALLKAVEEELTKRSLRLRFTEMVEVRFEADTQQQRSRNMVWAGLISALIYVLFLFNDYSFRPDAFTTAVLLRAGLMLAVGLPILWWVYRGVTPALREAMMSMTVITAMVISCMIFAASSAPYSYLDVFSFGLILVVGNIVYSLRFGYACVSSIISILIMLVFVVSYEPMPIEAKRLAMFTIVAKAMFTLVANYRLEFSERNSYLLVLREKLRAGYYLQDNQKLSYLSMTDPLTDISNRRKFDAILPIRWQEGIDRNESLGLMVVDIDHFKAYNDYYGHLQGDQCLRQVSAALQVNSRNSDLVVRFGGEEFVILMPSTSSHVARQEAERLRHSIEALQIPHQGCLERNIITVSVGAAVITPTIALMPNELLARADLALYEAKRQGRNCIWVASSVD